MGARSLTRSFLDCALISSCSRRSGLALGLGELLHLVGNELGGRLLDLALERGEGSQRLGQLAALAHLGRHLRLVLRQRVDHQRPRRRPLIDEALTHVDALLGQRQQPLARRDACAQAVARGSALGMLRQQARPAGGQLREVCGKDAFLAPANGVTGAGSKCHRRRLGAAPARRSDGHAAARPFCFRRFKVARQGLAVGTGLGGVELQQQIAGGHPAAVLDRNGDDLAGLERLHDLGASAWLDAALGDGVDVEPAEIGPSQGGGKGGADQPDGRHPHGRRRRFQQFQGRGEEFPVDGVHLSRQRGSAPRRTGCI